MIKLIYAEEEQGGDVKIEYEIEDSSMLEYVLEHFGRFLRAIGFILEIDGNLEIVNEHAVLAAYREGLLDGAKGITEDDGNE